MAKLVPCRTPPHLWKFQNHTKMLVSQFLSISLQKYEKWLKNDQIGPLNGPRIAPRDLCKF